MSDQGSAFGNRHILGKVDENFRRLGGTNMIKNKSFHGSDKTPRPFPVGRELILLNFKNFPLESYHFDTARFLF